MTTRVSSFVLKAHALVAVCLLVHLMTSCGGKNLGQELDDLEGRITSTAGLLGHTGGLAEAQMLDILKLRIEELRKEWAGDLTKGVNTLDTQQQMILNNFNTALGGIHGLLNHLVTIEDMATIDGNVFLSKFGLARTDQIRRITPSAQIHKRLDGYYIYQITLPLFGTGNTIKDIKINDLDVFSYKTDEPPHSVRISVPADKLEQYFDDWKLGRANILISLEVPNGHWWNMWSGHTTIPITISTGLFPRYPLRYWFAQHPVHQVIDTDPGHLQPANSPQTLIPGCGVSGCYWSYSVCAVAPLGTRPTGEIIAKYDSFQGWGEFVGPVSVSNNLTCWTYRQHSHNQNRNVWFSTRYQPLTDVQDIVYYNLVPADVPKVHSNLDSGRTQLLPVSFPVIPAGNYQIAEQVQRAVKMATEASQLVISGASPVGSANNPPPNGAANPVENANYFPPNADTGPTPRPIEYGMTYFAPYKLDVNFELVVQAFTGEPPITLSNTVLSSRQFQGSDVRQLQAAPENGTRLRIDTTAPY
jgi:hypothetical protein